MTTIDNDVSFGPYLVGVGKFKIDYHPKRLEKFKEKLEVYCAKVKTDPDEIMEKIKKNGYVIDMNTASREEISALRKTLEFQAFSQPQQMSRGLCDKLKSLSDDQIEAFAKTLAQNVDNQDAIRATAQRLKEMKQIAIEYEQAGKVIDDDKWETESVVRKEMECPSLIKGQNRYSDPNYIVDYQMSSILARDFGDVLPSQWK